MEQLLKKLCSLNGTSGREQKVREFIIENVKNYCTVKVDNCGNIICLKKGKFNSENQLMIDAHMDEVGFIVTSICEDGFIKFETVGGIDPSVVLARRVVFQNGTVGVISSKPIHLLSAEERKKMPEISNMYIDIGANSKEDAEKYIALGDTAVFQTEYLNMGNKFLSKAIDNRVGCAILIKLLQEESMYDYYATFTWGEEIGLRGAKTATYTVNPKYAIVLEATTASDLAGVPASSKVCELNGGAVISFMDKATLYDKDLFNLSVETAKLNNIKYQIKSAVAGGNNAGAIHQTRKGVKTLALSVPCRYIHSGSSVAALEDVFSVYNLAKQLIKELCK